MAILLLEQARFHQARSFYRDIYNGNDKFYLAASRTETWTDDTAPDTSVDNRVDVQKFRDKILFVGLIGTLQVILYMIGMMMLIVLQIPPILVLHHYRLQTILS